MGKGDKRSKKGKLFHGSNGKSRPNPKKLKQMDKNKTNSENKS